MRILFSSLFLFSCALCAYGDQSSQQQAMQEAYQQFIQVDEQIENLVKQKLQLKAKVAEHMERGSTGLLPGVGRRQSAEAGDLSQQIQALSQQITQLEEKRSDLLLSLQ